MYSGRCVQSGSAAPGHWVDMLTNAILGLSAEMAGNSFVCDLHKITIDIKIKKNPVFFILLPICDNSF
jgi:hypothetical protein